MNKYKWKIKQQISEEIIAKFPEVNPVVLQLLADRGLSKQEEIDEYLHPDYSKDIHDPYLFSQMKQAVDRIYQAKKKKEKVIIYGDYDADGVCGSSILHKIFKEIDLDFETYLPDREKEGYGLNLNSIDEFKNNKVDLIITVDCGISNKEEVDRANQYDIDVIVTDHHNVPKDKPEAVAIIHPLLDESYPFKNLAGGAVAFKLAQAILLDKRFKIVKAKAEAFEKWLLDLVAISIVADMVPLIRENRTLVKYGLMVLRKTKNLGLQKLMEVGMVNMDKINARTIGFQIAPRINAAGRMDHANSAYKLLTTDNIEEAIVIAHQLNKKNIERQNLTDKLVEEAKKQIGENPKEAILFARGENWNPGIIGLVSSKITQTYARPSIVLSSVEDKLVASGRSIEEFNLIESLTEFSDYFIKFGGHKGAAGFSLEPAKYEEFKEKFISYAQKKLKGVDFMPALIIDKEISLKQTDWELIEALEDFKPFGWGNFQPRFLIKNLTVDTAETLGKDGNHLKLLVKDGNISRKIICFGYGEICQQLKKGDIIEAVCEPGINEWNGNREIQLSLVDIKKK